MLIIPLIITMITLGVINHRFEHVEPEPALFSLVPMWVAYIAIAVCDIYQIL